MKWGAVGEHPREWLESSNEFGMFGGAKDLCGWTLNQLLALGYYNKSIQCT